MTRYTVTVTGTWNMELDADSVEEAEQFALNVCLDEGMDTELMNLEFEAFNEENE